MFVTSSISQFWRIRRLRCLKQKPIAVIGDSVMESFQQRRTLCSIFAFVLAGLKKRSPITKSAPLTKLASVFAKAEGPFKFAVVQDAQDISISQLRFLAAPAGKHSNGLFFAMDQGQRIHCSLSHLADEHLLI